MGFIGGGQNIFGHGFFGKATSVAGWTFLGQTPDRQPIQSIAYGMGVLMAVETFTSLLRSTDGGVTWTKPLTLAGGLSFGGNIATDGAGTWIAADNGAFGNPVSYYRSTDNGVTWSAAINFPVNYTSANTFFAFGAANHVVAVGNNNGFNPTSVDNYAVSTDNGATWALPELFANGQFQTVMWDGTRFVASGFHDTTSFQGTVNTSANGNNWVETIIPGTTWPNFSSSPNQNISFDATIGLYLVSLSNNTDQVISAATPAGLAAAAHVSTGLGNGLKCSIGAHKKFFVFDDNGGAALSINGTAWQSTPLNFPAGNVATCCTYDEAHARFIAAGSGGCLSFHP